MASGGPRRSPWGWWLVLALAVVGIAALGWGAFGGQTSAPEQEQQSEADSQDGVAEQLTALQRRESDDPFAMGSTDAPVVLIKYEDFRCPYCTKYTADVEPELIDRYVREGVLRIEWRDFPVFGDESVEMAKAGRAAARQDSFWEFHDVAYAMGDEDEKASFPEERIQQVAREAEVPDLAKFNEDRDDPEIMQEIQADMAEGQQIGLSSVSSFLINEQAILGAQPLDQFVSVIDEERAGS